MILRQTYFYKLLIRYVKPVIVKVDRKRFGRYPAPEKITSNKIAFIKQEFCKLCVGGGGKFDCIKEYYISKKEYDAFEKKFPFRDFYDSKAFRYQRKICEYFLVDKILELPVQNSEYSYIDAASMNSPWAAWLKERYGIKSYSIDKQSFKNPRNCFICSDITNLPFENCSINAISIQSAFELLSDDTDIKFVRECGRVLKRGGRVVILPL